MRAHPLSPVFKPVKSFTDTRFQRWLKRRMPARRSATLTRNNIFIFPSRAGFGYLFLMTLLWLLATNFENNLVFALTFLLASLFVVSILHTFANLSGLKITAVRAQSAFVGEDAIFELLIEKSGPRLYENLLLSWPGRPPAMVSLGSGNSRTLKLYTPAQKRGWFHPGRLLIETRYPLGLLRAWTWLDLDLKALVYPAPVKAALVLNNEAKTGEGNITHNTGSEDFQGFKDYRPGDSLRHISWKHFAREQGLFSKSYTATADKNIWLDWDALAGLNRESRLSRLCFWVLEAGKGNDSYGLRLPGVEVSPGKGAIHQETLLRELALFEWERQ